MEIETIAEWDAICRICLQEGQLHSLFDYDDEKSDLNIAEKIMLCSQILVSLEFYRSNQFLDTNNCFKKIYFSNKQTKNQNIDHHRWKITRANMH